MPFDEVKDDIKAYIIKYRSNNKLIQILSISGKNEFKVKTYEDKFNSIIV